MSSAQEDYLIGRIGRIRVGFHCQDVTGVFNNDLKITLIANQASIYLGLCTIHGKTMQVIDLRKRLSMSSATEDHIKSKNIVTFQTGMEHNIALVVDIIEGLEAIQTDSIGKNSIKTSHLMNMNLLFPSIGKLENGEIIHILDATYLDKIEPIAEEDSGGLELF